MKMLQLLLFTVVCVSFSRAKFLAEEADEMMTITVQASSFSFRPYIIMIEPVEDLPVGGPGIQCSYRSYAT